MSDEEKKRVSELEAENMRLRKGFSECFRVLESGGFLIFKWNETQVRINEVVKLAPVQPLFGQRGKKTHWLVFMKGDVK